MLVLTCKLGKAIVIGDNIRLTVVAIERRRLVRLGFTAPASTRIFRAEVLARQRKRDLEGPSPDSKTDAKEGQVADLVD
jgi:carbon storage regulator CsrA